VADGRGVAPLGAGLGPSLGLADGDTLGAVPSTHELDPGGDDCPDGHAVHALAALPE